MDAVVAWEEGPQNDLISNLYSWFTHTLMRKVARLVTRISEQARQAECTVDFMIFL